MTDPKWFWKKTSTECYYEVYATTYQLTLVTREALQEGQVLLALRHLFRKLPNLRVCFAERDGEVWLKEMEKEIIDFEVVNDVRGDDVHRILQDYDFNKETGPLWCVRLRPEPQRTPDGDSREEVPGFPHMYSLFFGINHAITDGTSNVKMSSHIVQLLDEVLGGKVINDEEQLTVYIPHDKTQNVLREQEGVLRSNAELQRQLAEEYKILQGQKPLVKTFLKGEGQEGKTLMLTRDFDPETSAAFIKRCRAEGVTVNSAFTAVASLAMVDVLAEEGLQQDSYRIRSDHVVNARRYWEGDTSPYVGCHLMPFTWAVVETPRDIGGGFWAYAKSLNEKLYKKIAQGVPVLETVTKDLVDATPDPTYEFDFCVTNMGEVTKVLSKGGNHVHLVHVIRSAAIHIVPFTLLHFLHSFRGRMVHTLTYNSLFVTPRIAEKCRERIFQHLVKYVR